MDGVGPWQASNLDVKKDLRKVDWSRHQNKGDRERKGEIERERERDRKQIHSCIVNNYSFL